MNAPKSQLLASIGFVSIAFFLTVSLAGCGLRETGGKDRKSEEPIQLFNASYDPTRELYAEIDPLFTADYEKKTGKKVTVSTRNNGSGAQKRNVIEGNATDVVTLALSGDIDDIAAAKLMDKNWQKRLPENSCPYWSTIVFLVRKGNPKNIKDWPDLQTPELKIITPNPKTSGGARYNFLAAWGSVKCDQMHTEQEARDLVKYLYGNVVRLDTGARAATESFVKRKQGDVLIAWENEAIAVSKEDDSVEIIYPPASIRAEPPVAVVDKNVDERKTRAEAEAYLKFLYTDAAQEIIAKHGFRPSNEEILKKNSQRFPDIRLFTVEQVTGSWAEAQDKYFDDGGIFDQIRMNQ